MDHYLNAIRSYCPTLTFQSAKHMDHGQNNEILMLDQAYIFRFPKSELNRKILHVEADCLSILSEKLSFNIPHYSYVHFGAHLYDTFVGYEMIEGEMLKRELLEKLDRFKIGYQLSEILKELHGRQLKDLMSSRVREEDPYMVWQDMYVRIKRQLFPMMKPIKQAEVTRDFDRILDMLSDTSFESCLVHGDFGPTNILVNPKTSEITGIIDFGEIHIGDPAEDISSLIGTYGYGPDFILDTFDAYPEAKDMVERALLYTKTFALQEALYGIENNDQGALDAGMENYYD